MEQQLASLLCIITSEFWPLFLIIVLLLMKDYRLGGLLLIALRCIMGSFYWYHFSAVAILIFFTDWLCPKYYFEKKYNEKVAKDKASNPSRRDPDYTK